MRLLVIKRIKFASATARLAYFFVLLKNKLCAGSVLSVRSPNLFAIAFAFGDQRLHLWIMTSQWLDKVAAYAAL
jgi:hypothetical protein